MVERTFFFFFFPFNGRCDGDKIINFSFVTQTQSKAKQSADADADALKDIFLLFFILKKGTKKLSRL